MSMENDIYSARAAELRGAFDRAFESEPDPKKPDWVDVLSLGISGGRYAIRLREIAGIAKCGKIVPMPSKAQALLGVAGIRGELIPVFSLGALLGCPSAEEANWLMLCGETARLGLAFGQFNGCYQAGQSAFSRSSDASSDSEIVTIRSAAHTVVSIPRVIESITKQDEGS